VLVHPGTAGQRFVAGEIHPAVDGLAEIAAGRRFPQHVVHAGELGAHPLRNGVLIADVVDAEPGREGGEPGGSAIPFDPPEGLREIGLPAPDGNVQGPLRRPRVDSRDKGARRRRIVIGADERPAARRIA
jgi:hypothetical protein